MLDNSLAYRNKFVWPVPPQSRKAMNMLSVFVLTCLASANVERMGLSTGRTAVLFLGHNRKSRFYLQNFQCSFHKFEIKLNANALFHHISYEKIVDCT
jgi:hypothetical protein